MPKCVALQSPFVGMASTVDEMRVLAELYDETYFKEYGRGPFSYQTQAPYRPGERSDSAAVLRVRLPGKQAACHATGGAGARRSVASTPPRRPLGDEPRVGTETWLTARPTRPGSWDSS